MDNMKSWGVVFLVFAASACSTGTDAAGSISACAVGVEGCACFSNGTCNGALTCASDLCVNLGGSGGTAGSGGAVGTGGTGGAAGSGGAAGRGGTGGGSGGIAGSGGAGGAPGDAGPGCPGLAPNDGDSCSGNARCPYSDQTCRCRNGSWTCIATTDGGMFPQPDSGNAGQDAGARPAACPATEPVNRSQCTPPDAGSLTCDYGAAGVTCMCTSGVTGWRCL
jgi:hypothetical protein